MMESKSNFLKNLETKPLEISQLDPNFATGVINSSLVWEEKVGFSITLEIKIHIWSLIN